MLQAETTVRQMSLFLIWLRWIAPPRSRWLELNQPAEPRSFPLLNTQCFGISCLGSWALAARVSVVLAVLAEGHGESWESDWGSWVWSEGRAAWIVKVRTQVLYNCRVLPLKFQQTSCSVSGISYPKHLSSSVRVGVSGGRSRSTQTGSRWTMERDRFIGAVRRPLLSGIKVECQRV